MDEFGKILALRGEVAANGVRRAVLDSVDPTDPARSVMELRWRWRLT